LGFLMYSGSEYVKVIVSPTCGKILDGSKPKPGWPFVSSMPTVTVKTDAAFAVSIPNARAPAMHVLKAIMK